MQDPVPVVYKTGETLSQIFQNNKSAENQPAPVITPDQIAPTPDPVVTPASVVSEPVVVIPTVDPVAPVVSEPVKEPNVADFKFEEFEPQGTSDATIPSTRPEVNLDDLLKKADAKEILKKLGVSDFAIEIDQHIRGGGQAVDYLQARAIDYSKISDDSLLKDDLRKQYPTLQPHQIDMMFERKYSPLTELQDDKDFAEIQKQADAYKVRQSAIAEQQKFKISETVVPTVVDNREQEIAQQQQYEKVLNFYKEHPDTQNLMTSKRVAIDLGADGKFNYNIDKPEYLTRAILDGEFWKRITSANPKEPDVAKLVPNVALQQKLAFIAMNPNYEKDLVNYGRSLQLPALVKEGQNVVPPTKIIPMQPEQQGIDWSKTRTGKVSDHKN